jgi:hypothetical protein
MPIGAPIAWLLLGLAAVAGGGCANGSKPSAVRAPQIAGREGVPRLPSQAVVRPRTIAPGEEEKPAGLAFEYAYVAPESPDLQRIHERVREADLLRRLPEVQAIDGMFLLPRRLRFVTAECGEFGAFYRPGAGEIALCYETLRTLYERGREQQKAGQLEQDYPLRYTRANVRFIVLHETGHALVDLLDLPVTGRQEDAVDQLAAMLMLHFAGLDEKPAQVIGNLRMAADWMLVRSTGAYALDAYADEHALAEQRYFNLQCLIYGTDPVGYGGIVGAGDLTPARARVCPRETQAVGRAWLRLLLPHLAPKYEMTEAEAIRYFERQDFERQK